MASLENAIGQVSIFKHWFGHDLIFATLSREKQLGQNILATGDKRQQRKGQGCQDVVWTQLRAKIPLRSFRRGRDQIPHPSPDFEFPEKGQSLPESPDLSTIRQPQLPDPTHPMPFRLKEEAQL